MQKTLRKITAKETLEITEKGFYISKVGNRISIEEIQKAAVKETKFFATEMLDEVLKEIKLEPKYETIFEVIEETTLNSIQRVVGEGFENPMCLNFASAKNPGGGFFNGAQAQEESIARSTGLYPCQISAFEFYETHRAMKSCLYTDGMIYSPRVPVLRKDNGELLDMLILCSIITVAAVNMGVVKKFEADKLSEVQGVMQLRIDKLLALSARKGHTTLILGAWGCGVFQNDPVIIAKLFSGLLNEKYQGVFEKVVFAVYAKNKKFIEAFQNEFSK